MKTNQYFLIKTHLYSRLYETQVKKIVKVQCMMRAFLAKRNFKGKMQARQASLRQKSQDSVDAEPTQPAASGNDERVVEGVEEEEEAEGEEGDDNETVAHDEQNDDIEEENEEEPEAEE